MFSRCGGFPIYRACMQENTKAVLRRDEVKKMESQLFYKCYKQGAVEADVNKKEDTAGGYETDLTKIGIKVGSWVIADYSKFQIKSIYY